jgi:hypothetical protein
MAAATGEAVRLIQQVSTISKQVRLQTIADSARMQTSLVEQIAASAGTLSADVRELRHVLESLSREGTTATQQ